MRTRLVGILTLAACGGGGGGDAGVDGARCNAAAPFGAPTIITELASDEDDFAARLSADELEIVFARSSASGYDVWSASRASVADVFGAPTLLTTVNSVYADLWPALSADGLTLVFDSERPTPGTSHVFETMRSARTSTFAPPAMLVGLAANDVQPFLVASGHTLYFASAARPGLGGRDLWRAALDGAGMVGTPEAVTGLVNTSDDEDDPVVTADELTLYFRHSTPTGSDIYVSTRPSTSDLFGPPTPVMGASEPGVVEGASWVSPDGCHLYLHSDAPTLMGGPAKLNLYVASKP